MLWPQSLGAGAQTSTLFGAKKQEVTVILKDYNSSSENDNPLSSLLLMLVKNLSCKSYGPSLP